MLDLNTLIARMIADGVPEAVARNAAAQFGTAARRYVGAELLPERQVPDNAYREEAIRYRTVVANDGTRYSPTQKKGQDLIGSFLVELGESDIAREMTGREFDALIRFLNQNRSMEATAQIVNWLDTVINAALLENNERQRWEALVDASVTRRGDNEYAETVVYSDPANHRVNAGGTWSDNAYNPFDDIFGQAQVLWDKGYTVSRIITRRAVSSIMSLNTKVKQHTGTGVVVNTSGDALTSVGGRASLEQINLALQAEELPPIEVYDAKYRETDGVKPFLADGTMVLVAETGRTEEVDLGDEIEFVEDTVGYHAIGRAAGQADPGRVIRMEHKMDKPPRLEAEGWSTHLPVITEPEAIAVIKSIS